MTQASPNSFLVIFVPIALIGLIAGLRLLIHGWRGRRIDDHPTCGACHFDLSGTLPTGKACPECGADVSIAANITYGNRTGQSKGQVIAGTILLLFAIGIVTLPMAGVLQNFNWQRVKPVWLLRHQAYALSGISSDKAWAELQRRLAAGDLSQAEVDELNQFALKLQSDMTRTWSGEAGSFLEQSETAGMIRRNDWLQYLQTAGEQGVEVVIRPEISIGSDWPYRIYLKEARVAGDSDLCRSILKSQFALSGKHLFERRGGASSILTADTGGSGGTFGGNQYMREMKPGSHTIDSDIDIAIYRSFPAKDSGDEPLLEMSLTRSSSFNLLPATMQTTERIDSQSALTDTMAALTLKALAFDNHSNELEVVLRIQPRPVALSHGLYVEHEGKRMRLGSIVMHESSETNLFSSARDQHFKSLLGKPVNIILIPEPQAAAHSVDIVKYLHREISLGPVVVQPK